MKKTLFLLLGPGLFLLVRLAGPFEGMSLEAQAILASTLWIAAWWVTEVIPIAVTSLLPLVLFPLSGGLAVKDTAAAFGNKMIFLYLGGFIIAIAIQKWNLHKRIALNVISFMGNDLYKMVLGFMIATAFLSMWISNTATTVMMLPIGLAIINQLRDSGKLDIQTISSFSKVLMLGIAYSASIGGISTLIGTPPNLVLAGIIGDYYDIDLAFGSWFLLVFPMSVVLLLICWKFLVHYAFPLTQKLIPGGNEEIKAQIKSIGTFTSEEKWVLAVFILTGLAWISRSFLLVKFIPAIDDSIIAVVGASALFIMPSSDAKHPRLLVWEDCQAIPWGIILLFGGGLAIAEAFKVSGLASWIGTQTSLLEGAPIFLVLIVIVLLVNFLTEITSNVATTAMILPVLIPVTMVLDVHPFLLMFAATIAASCAFMLPVATPPNAVVFGSGFLKIKDMMRAGLFLNLISILIITGYLYFMLPWFLDMGLFDFPIGLD